MTDRIFLKTSQAAKYIGISTRTLKTYEENGWIVPYVPAGCQRRFDKADLDRFLRINKSEQQEKTWKVAYARVSSVKQKDDLQRQVKYLKEKYPDYEVVCDVGSGVNFSKTRKNFRKIIERAQQGYKISLAVAHHDRLCRFGFELIEYIIELAGGEIICEDDEMEKSREEELAEDLLSIIQVFNCRQMGRRRYKHKGKEIEGNESEASEV